LGNGPREVAVVGKRTGRVPLLTGLRLHWPRFGEGRADAVTVVVPDDVTGFVSLEPVSFVSRRRSVLVHTAYCLEEQ